MATTEMPAVRRPPRPRTAALATLAALVALAVAGCNRTPQEDTVDSMNAALARTTPDQVGALTPGSPEEQAALDRFADLVADMSPARTAGLVPSVYADSVYFNDTLKEVHGADALAAYFRHSLGGAESVTARLVDVARSGSDYYVRWEMDIVFKKLADGRRTRSAGMSHLRFDGDGKVVFHQDYWDSTAGFFQYVPVVGRLLGYVKGKL